MSVEFDHRFDDGFSKLSHYFRWLKRDLASIIGSPISVTLSSALNQPICSIVHQDVQRYLHDSVRDISFVSLTSIETKWFRTRRELGISTKHDPCLSIIRDYSGVINAIDIKLDGSRVVSGSEDSSVTIWDSVTCCEITRLHGHEKGVTCVKFSADGTQIVSGSRDKTVRVWDAIKGSEIVVFGRHASVIISAVFKLQANDFIYSVSEDSIHVWETLHPGASVTHSVNNSLITCSAYHYRNNTMATGLNSGVIQILSTRRGDKKLNLTSESISCMAFSHEGSLLVSGSAAGMIFIYEVDREQVYNLMGHTDGICSISFNNADGTTNKDQLQVISSSLDKTVRLWKVADKSEIACHACYSGCNQVAFDGDGKKAVFGTEDSIQVWDAARFGYDDTSIFHIHTASFSIDCSHIVYAVDEDIHIWDAHRGVELLTWLAHDMDVTSVAFSNSGSKVVSSSEDKFIKIWDSISGQLLTTSHEYKSCINVACFNCNETLIASGAEDGTIHLWNFERKEIHFFGISSTKTNLHEVLTLSGHTQGVTALLFTEDGERLVSGSDDETILVWNCESGDIVGRCSHDCCVTSLSLGLDDTILIAGLLDGKIVLWNSSSYTHITTLTGHTDAINSVAFNNDSTLMVSSSHDNTARVWDVKVVDEINSIREIARLEHGDVVRSAQFNSDATRVLVVSQDSIYPNVWSCCVKKERLE